MRYRAKTNHAVTLEWIGVWLFRGPERAGRRQGVVLDEEEAEAVAEAFEAVL